jgi:Malectin domain
VENSTVAKGLDVFQAAGGINKVIVLEKILTINDGFATIKLVRSIENPIVSGIEIISVVASTSKPVVVPATPTASPVKRIASPVTRINVAGLYYKDSVGNEWLSDDYHDGKGFADRQCPRTITNTTDAVLYCTYRWFSTQSDETPFQYEIPVPSNFESSYLVRLHFAELFFTMENQRVFSVRVENMTVVEKLDVVRASGGPNVAYVISVKNVTVRDGFASIEFVNGKENPFISAIEVIQQFITANPAVAPVSKKEPTTAPKITSKPAKAPSISGTHTNASSGIAMVRINAGGAEVIDVEGNTWTKDQYFGGKGLVYAAPSCPNSSIANTVNDKLYCEHRWFGPWDIAPKAYNIPVSKSNNVSQQMYDVRLHFAEIVSVVPETYISIDITC